MATGSVVLFMICIVLGAVLGTIIYRISLISVIHSGFGHFIKGHVKLFTSMSAALINLIIIMMLTKVRCYIKELLRVSLNDDGFFLRFIIDSQFI